MSQRDSDGADGSEEDLSTFLAMRLDPTPRAEVLFRAVVREGPDGGASFVVDDEGPGRTLVGTSSSCAARLTDRSVSRRHLALEIDGDRLHLVDLGSKNGTRVGGLAVRDAWLVGGESVALGATVLTVGRESVDRGRDAPSLVEHELGRLVGVSREMRRLFPVLRKLAAADLPVLLEGETGTGKETAALTLHEIGPRRAGPFVTLDCAGLDEKALDLELGSVFELARGGTLFIDEIAELPLPAQAKLLRLLDREAAAANPLPAARILSSTRLDLDDAIARQRFRDDLYHRIAVARIELPPLRARRGDLPFLAAHFCRELGGEPSRLPAATMEDWTTFRWPGNLRELRNAVAQRLVLGELSELEPRPADKAPAGDWMERILEEKRALTDARSLVVHEFERRYVEHMLRASGGNVARAAATSGVARRYFQILKARLGL